MLGWRWFGAHVRGADVHREHVRTQQRGDERAPVRDRAGAQVHDDVRADAVAGGRERDRRARGERVRVRDLLRRLQLTQRTVWRDCRLPDHCAAAVPHRAPGAAGHAGAQERAVRGGIDYIETKSQSTTKRRNYIENIRKMVRFETYDQEKYYIW